MGAAIEVRGLTKDFGETRALDGVSFSVGEGEIFGFIGPNGAGKTTTIRILSTLLDPTAGDASVCGSCVVNQTEEVRRLIGYMPDHFGVYEGITVVEYLEFFAGAYRLPRRERRATIEGILELTDLTALKERMVPALSKGMKQRLSLARALIHNPRVLILDEPAAALDPRARIEIRALLKELRGMGKTIFISSHILAELSDLCTSVGVIEKGRLVACGPLAGLERRLASADRVRVTLCDGALEGTALQDRDGRGGLLDLLEAHPQVSGARLEGSTLSFRYGGPAEEFHGVVKILTDHGVPFLSVEYQDRDLERLFMELTRGDVQ